MSVVIAVSVLTGLYFGIPRVLNLWWYSGIPDLVPKSDVPVTRDLVYAPGAAEVEVLEMSVQGTTVAKEKKTGGGCRFILQAKLRCRMKGKPLQDRPLLQCVQVASRPLKRGHFGDSSEAEIEIFPVSNCIKDAAYQYDAREIEVTIEDIVDAMSMGENVYRVRCGNHTGSVTLYYDPKSSRTGIEKKPSEKKLPLIEIKQ